MTQDSNPMPMGELSLKERALLLIADENEFKGNKLYYHREKKWQWAVITLVPKVFLFVGLTTLGTIVNFDWFVY